MIKKHTINKKNIVKAIYANIDLVSALMVKIEIY